MLARLQHQRTRQQAQRCRTGDHELGGLADVLAQHQPGLEFFPAADIGQGLARGLAIGRQLRVGDRQPGDRTPAQQCFAILHLRGVAAPQHQPADGIVVQGGGIGQAFRCQLARGIGVGRQQHVERRAIADLRIQLAGGRGADVDLVPGCTSVVGGQPAGGVGEVGGHGDACLRRRRRGGRLRHARQPQPAGGGQPQPGNPIAFHAEVSIAAPPSEAGKV